MAPIGFAGRPLREIDDNTSGVPSAAVRTRERSPVVRPSESGRKTEKMRLKFSLKRPSGGATVDASVVGDDDDVRGGTVGGTVPMVGKGCETPKTHYGSTRDAFGTPAGSLGLVDDADEDDDDDARVSDDGAAIVVRTPNAMVPGDRSEGATTSTSASASSSLALVVELDAALERERALVDFVREQMADCDARVGAMSLDVEDLMAALGERASAEARARWRWATRAVIETTRREKERREAKRLRARAARLEEQLRRVERYVATAAKDFDDLNAKLVTEARAAEQAREAERRALAQLASARDSAPLSPAQTTPSPVRRNNKFRAANERRAAAKAACASVAAHVEALLASSPSKQLEDLGKAQRDAVDRLRARAVPLPSSDGDDLDPSDVVALIAVHALERCSERSASDGARAFHRAAERFERVARVCLESKD